MPTQPILVVDDEKNIRLTMRQSLEPLGLPIQSAVNGEEALRMLREASFSLIFLDLKLPGMDGMDVLRAIRSEWPCLRVVIITAHGTVESAVEAMKLGAVDFIQKPFSPVEIRDVAKLVLDREALDEAKVADYRSIIELAKRHITNRDFAAARDTVRKAIAADPSQPEAYNLLGALHEIVHQHSEALGFYRAALDIDPTYKPALANLERATSLDKFGVINLGMEEEEHAVSQAGEAEGEDHGD